ncbi:hypothetical protein KVT40_009254 [Elsinoe batatas]|uniref:Uncharacterized protein n=1 Tax=Elsinoe batatas TaxID=2601811 RepID=A0A8K0PBX5_9PEZI|nr:hypothetical protein KVT40_009254 [Elsinoe batatas]
MWESQSDLGGREGPEKDTVLTSGIGKRGRGGPRRHVTAKSGNVTSTHEAKDEIGFLTLPVEIRLGLDDLTMADDRDMAAQKPGAICSEHGFLYQNAVFTPRYFSFGLLVRNHNCNNYVQDLRVLPLLYTEIDFAIVTKVTASVKLPVVEWPLVNKLAIHMFSVPGPNRVLAHLLPELDRFLYRTCEHRLPELPSPSTFTALSDRQF